MKHTHKQSSILFTFIIICILLSVDLYSATSLQSQEPTTQILGTPDVNRLLIISPDIFISDLELLVTHKEAHGMSTKMVSLTQVYDEMFWSGRDNQEKIKYFIKKAHETWGIEFVLLVGDFRHMPIRYIYNQDIQQGFNEPRIISDLYYADIYNADGSFSSWDTDHDLLFGEWIDDGIATIAEDQPIDLYPDIAIGRLACRTRVEVKTMVQKIITYETETYGSEWFNNILVCAGDTYPDYPGNEGEENTVHVLENMSDFQHIKLWTSDGSFTGVKDLLRVFQEGCGFAYFDGHANPYRWLTHPPGDHDTWVKGFSLMSMSLLRNKEKMPIVVVGGCHNNQIDVHLGKLLEDNFWYFTWVPECWGWKLTRKIGGGSIATIGCTGLGMTKEDKDSFSGAGDYLEPTFFYEYGVNGTEYLGETWANTITDYLKKYPIDWNTKAAWDYAIDAKTVQQWILLGDPSLKIGGYPQDV